MDCELKSEKKNCQQHSGVVVVGWQTKVGAWDGSVGWRLNVDGGRFKLPDEK